MVRAAPPRTPAPVCRASAAVSSTCYLDLVGRPRLRRRPACGGASSGIDRSLADAWSDPATTVPQTSTGSGEDRVAVFHGFLPRRRQSPSTSTVAAAEGAHTLGMPP